MAEVWETLVSAHGAESLYYDPPTTSQPRQSVRRALDALRMALPTKAELQASTIPDDVDVVHTLGYSAAGDSGGALYKRVVSEPSHAGKIQSADGAWWEIVPRDGAYVSAAQFGNALQDGIDYVAAQGGILLLGNKEYIITTPLSRTSNAKPFGILGTGRAKIVAGADIGTLLSLTSCTEFVLEGFAVDCQFSSFTTNANHGIVCLNCDDGLIRRVKVTDYKNSAILVYATVAETHKNVVLDHCESDGLSVANNGMLLVDMDESGMRHCTVVGVTGSPGHGQQLKNECRRCFIEDGYAENCVSGYSLASDTPGKAVRQSRVSDVIAFNCVRNGVVLGETAHNNLSGILIDMNNRASSLEALRFDSTAAVDNTVTGLHIYNTVSPKYGIKVDGDGNVVDAPYVHGNSSKAVIFNSGAVNNLARLGRVELSGSSTTINGVLDDNSGQTSNVLEFNGYRSRQHTNAIGLADDTVLIVKPAQTQGVVTAWTRVSDQQAILFFRVDSGFVQSIHAGADIATGTTVLTNGTADGVDTKINIHAVNDGLIYIKNRTGMTATIGYMIAA